jgi:hypothetical protein
MFLDQIIKKKFINMIKWINIQLKYFFISKCLKLISFHDYENFRKKMLFKIFFFEWIPKRLKTESNLNYLKFEFNF